MTVARGAAAFVEVCAPEQVGEDLARALAALLCRGLEHNAGQACDRCLAAGRVLARPVGRALLLARRSGRHPLGPADYGAIGQALEQLELEAGARKATGKRT